MAEFFDEYRQIQPAYESGALNLLQSPYSQTYIALFRSAFPDKTESRDADDLVALIESVMADLRSVEMEDQLPRVDNRTVTPEELCRVLTERFRWLESEIADDGHTTFRLTTEAMRAMDAVDSLSRVDAVFSGSLMRVLRDALTRAAAMLSADKRQRRQLLVERVKRAEEELKAFDQSGGRYTVSRESAAGEVRTLVSLMHDIPADLAKTSEGIRAETKATTEAFMADERPIGEIMGHYLERSRELFTGTEEGRSFLDAVSVISDPSQSAEIADLLEAIAGSPAFEGVEWQQRMRLTDAWSQVSQGIDRVLEEKIRATNVIGRAVTQFDSTDQRALSKALKELDHLVHTWAGQVSHQAELAIDTATHPSEIRTLITRTANVAPPPPPAELEEHTGDGLEVDLERLLREGGPRTAELMGWMLESPVLLADGRVSVSASFNALEAERRRSSEVVGLLQALEPMEGADTVRWECQDTDGFPLVWEGPDLVVTVEDLRRMAEGA